MRLRLRSSEWALIVYFSYVAVVSLFFPLTTSLKYPAFIAAAGAGLIIVLFALWDQLRGSIVSSMARDWLPLPLTLLSYREMNWFTKPHVGHSLEHAWIVWDRWLLNERGVRAMIESADWVGPGFLELCYLLVYAVGPFVVAILYVYRRRDLVDRVLLIYLGGTLLAYGLFPYFPSDPPRVVFEGVDLPHVTTVLRRLNLAIVGGVGIHSSVFPSAHVSSAFSGAWGLLIFLRERRGVGWGMLIYAVSVSVATVYGRYHYAVDAAAGFAISLAALLAAGAIAKRDRFPLA